MNQERSSSIRLDSGSSRMGILCVGMDAATRSSLEAITAQIPGVFIAGALDRYVTEREVARTLESCHQRVCIIDFDENSHEAGRLAERLRESCDHNVTIVAASSDTDHEQVVSAMRSGCSEYLLKPFSPERVLNALAHIESRRQSRGGGEFNGRIISVVGAKGGTGVTSLAVHLALSLAQSHKQKCLLIDEHPALGDVSLYLGLGRHQYSFYELVHNTDRLDTELLQGFLLQHSSGLDILDSPEAVDGTSQGSADAIEHTLSFLAENYQFVILDCPPGMTEATVAAIRQSDVLALVITPELPPVRNAVRVIEYLSGMHYPDSRINVVLNRHAKKNPINEQQIEQVLHRSIDVKIPNYYGEVVTAINTGTPLDLGQKSEWSAAIADWAETLTGKPELVTAAPEPRRFLSMFGL